MEPQKFPPLSGLELASIRMIAKFYSNGSCHWCGQYDGKHALKSKASFNGPCLIDLMLNGLIELGWTMDAINASILKVYK